MKLLSIILFLGLASIPGFAQNQIPNDFLGEWQGSGTLMGKDADFEMKWEKVLNDQFLKLTFRNGFSDGSFSMKAHGYYKLNDDGSLSGQWFDSRGTSFPLKGTFTSTLFTTEWEDSDVEKGRSEYRILESGEVQVTDFVLRNGSYQKFAEATYQSKNN